jgi:hypothetical protein
VLSFLSFFSAWRHNNIHTYNPKHTLFLTWGQGQ